MWVIENPATGLLKTRPFMERLPWVDVTCCKYATPYRKQTRLWTNMRWRPRRGVAGRQAPRAAGAAADGGAVREGQPITRAALQRSCCAVRGDCARGHGGACGAAEHSGLGGFLQGAWNKSIFPCFCMFFWAVPLNTKNGEEGHPPPLFSFLGAVIQHQKRLRGTALHPPPREPGRRGLRDLLSLSRPTCHSFFAGPVFFARPRTLPDHTCPYGEKDWLFTRFCAEKNAILLVRISIYGPE